MTSKVASSFEIRTPLFAFERFLRGTGTIRKTCIFENLTQQPLALDIRYGFKEHSWIQLYPESGEIDAEDPDRMTLEPGETRVRVLINTDNSNFPYDRFRGRVYFVEHENPKSEQWLEISFEMIEELHDFEGYAAIDLGTSNSTIALYHLQRDAATGSPWSPVLEDGCVDVPSVVFLRDLGQFRKLAHGSCAVGREALAEYRSKPSHDPRSLLVGVKRLIGTNRLLAADSFGAGGYVDPLHVLYMQARSIRERCQSHEEVRARIRNLIVTFPPTWEYKQIDRWKRVFRQMGFSDEQLDLSLDEASAAGLFYIYKWTRDEDARNRLLQDLLPSRKEIVESGERGEQYVLDLLSFDFGGGTIDLAFIQVELTLSGSSIGMRITLSGSDSLSYGGDQVTLAVFRILKRRLAMALADPARLMGLDTEAQAQRAAQASAESGLFLLPSGRRRGGNGRLRGSPDRATEVIRERWEELEKLLSADHLPADLEDAVDALFPTRFWQSSEEPLSATAKRNFGWLWEQAETLKKDIFREASGRMKGLGLSEGSMEDIRGGIYLRDIPEDVSGSRAGRRQFDDLKAWVSIGEIYGAISGPLSNAVDRARQLIGDQRIDRVVLTGQSSWIPLVRRLFVRARSEGGFGLAPTKIEFDEENAKAAVSKGASLLRVMRDTQVGFSVDVSDFKVNLLGDIFYKKPMGGNRTLFRTGTIDDLSFEEESPDPQSFARHLAVFHGSQQNLLGQFDFGDEGEALPEFEAQAAATAHSLGLEDGFPGHREVMRMRERDPQTYAKIASAMRDWPERVVVSWVEASASPGSAERPVYRYYLSRNRNLLAVRNTGDGPGRLFTLRVDDRPAAHFPPAENPFSGVH